MVSQVGNEESIFGLLVGEFFRIDIQRPEIFIEGRLTREFALVELPGPEGMLPQVLPVDPLTRIFLQQPLQKIIKHV